MEAVDPSRVTLLLTLEKAPIEFNFFELTFVNEAECKYLVELGYATLTHYTFSHAYSITEAGRKAIDTLHLRERYQ